MTDWNNYSLNKLVTFLKENPHYLELKNEKTPNSQSACYIALFNIGKLCKPLKTVKQITEKIKDLCKFIEAAINYLNDKTLVIENFDEFQESVKQLAFIWNYFYGDEIQDIKKRLREKRSEIADVLEETKGIKLKKEIFDDYDEFETNGEEIVEFNVEQLEDEMCYEIDGELENSDIKYFENDVETSIKVEKDDGNLKTNLTSDIKYFENDVETSIKTEKDDGNLKRNLTSDIKYFENDVETSIKVEKDDDYAIDWKNISLEQKAEEIFIKKLENFSKNRSCTCFKEFIEKFYVSTSEDDKENIFLNDNGNEVNHENFNLNNNENEQDVEMEFEYEEDDYDFIPEVVESIESDVNDEYKVMDDFPDFADDFPDFSDLSSDDGLEEIEPFPKKKKLEPRSKIKSIIECKYCGKIFKNQGNANAHENTVHAEKSRLCYKCGKVSKLYRSLMVHERICNLGDEVNKSCSECKIKFQTDINYYDHINTRHTKQNPYVCACKHAFSCYNKIINHYNRSDCGSVEDFILPHYMPLEFLKSFLEKRYADEEDFIERCQKTKFWCHICKRNAIRNRFYMKHFAREFHQAAEGQWLLEHNIPNMFPCDMCNQDNEPTTFETLHDLVNHRHATHHKCTLVNYFKEMERKSSIGLNELDPDINLNNFYDYSGAKSICHICNIEYRLSDFKKHFKTVHHLEMEKNWIEKNDLRIFLCNDCCDSYETLYELVEHQYNVHSKYPMKKIIEKLEGNEEMDKLLQLNVKLLTFNCNECDFSSNNRRLFVKHITAKHRIRYKCTCGKRFKQYNFLFTHFRISECREKYHQYFLQNKNVKRNVYV